MGRPLKHGFQCTARALLSKQSQPQQSSYESLSVQMGIASQDAPWETSTVQSHPLCVCPSAHWTEAFALFVGNALECLGKGAVIACLMEIPVGSPRELRM